MGKMFTLASTSHAAAAATNSGSSFLPLLIIVVLFGLFYFVMIRPQRNRQRRVQEMQNQVEPGARVRTTAGMYATVAEVDGDDVLLEVAPGVNLRFMKRAIMDVVPEETEDDAEEAETAEDAEEAGPAAEAPAQAGAAAPEDTVEAPEAEKAQAGKRGSANGGPAAS